MCAANDQHKPGLLSSIVRNKCSRCRRGDIFRYKNAYDLRNTLKMYERCSVCDQPMEPEVGFYYGTGFVSYALSVMACVVSFLAWMLSIGFSLDDNRIFWWIGANAVMLLIMQPLLMRISRTIWLAIFVHYDPQWNTRSPQQVERGNDEMRNNW